MYESRSNRPVVLPSSNGAQNMLKAPAVNIRKSLFINDPNSSLQLEWIISRKLVDYEEALSRMENRVQSIREGKKSECIWLLEHPPLYTAGTSANEKDLLDPVTFPVYKTGRGGQYTYHGPGQRIVYVMLDLKRRRPDVRSFVYHLESWIIDTLGLFDIRGERRRQRIGIWVPAPGNSGHQENKIAAIGVRLRRWVTFHGLSLNVCPELSHFSGIVPCGVSDQGVTSLAELGVNVTMDEIDKALMKTFEIHFGPSDIQIITD